MIFFKSLAILFFDILDLFIHQRSILKNLKKKKIIINCYFDVGCHKGLYTDLILNNFNVKKIFMFEPQKEIFSGLTYKYKNMKKIKMYNRIVSNDEKKKEIFINKHNLTSSLTKLNNKNLYLKLKSILFGGSIENMISRSYKIKAVKLSNIILKENIKSVDLLKIDTEGHELEVLQGLNNKIKLVKIILIEFHNANIYLKYNSGKIHRLLKSSGFLLHDKIKFPFTEWEDRIYINRRNTN